MSPGGGNDGLTLPRAREMNETPTDRDETRRDGTRSETKNEMRPKQMKVSSLAFITHSFITDWGAPEFDSDDPRIPPSPRPWQG